MNMINWLLVRLRSFQLRQRFPARDGREPLQIEALIRAHGDWLALFAAILERERVITSAELSQSLSEFASLTAKDRPAEGEILSFWAARVQDASAILRDYPSIH